MKKLFVNPLRACGSLNGLVTVDSAKWGTFDPNTWQGDHAEEVGNNLGQSALTTRVSLAGKV